jgi:hypothetical protein
MNNPIFKRPQLREALATWRDLLEAQKLATEPVWIFTENLCLEPSRTAPNSLQLGFQTSFTPPDDDALEIAYDQFAESGARMVFYRLGSSPRGSVCILLCDPWFESRNEREGFIRQEKWGISFFTGRSGEIEEITDLTRWLRRVKHNPAFRDFDFAMSLATVDEIKLYGRPLQPYERFAESLIGRLRRMLGNPA